MPSFCEVAGFRLSLTAVNYIALEMPVAGRAWTIMANNVRRKRDLSEPGHRVPPTGLDGPIASLFAYLRLSLIFFVKLPLNTVAGRSNDTYWADHTERAHQLVGHAARVCAAGDSAGERPRLWHVFRGGQRSDSGRRGDWLKPGQLGAVSHPDRGQDALPLLDGLRSQHDPADLSGRGALRGHRRRHLLPAEPLAAPVRPGARIPAFLGRHPVPVRFVCADSVSVPEAPREEAPDHRRPVHRVQGRVVCRGRIPAARATEPSRRRRCREGGQEAGRSAGGAEEGTGGAAETAKAF